MSERTEGIRCRVTEQEQDLIRSAAASSGLSISSLIRWPAIERARELLKVAGVDDD